MDKQLEPTVAIEYKVTYRNIKNPRLEFKTGTLQLILPKGYKKEKQLLEKHEKWISAKQQAIQTAIKQAKTKQLNQTRTLNQLKTLVYNLTKLYQNELHTKTNKTIFRKMKTKWASYSPRGNLTINTLLRYLPKSLIEYIIYHELTHAHERKHNERFWKMINKKFQNPQTMEKDLMAYWFKVQKTLNNPSIHSIN